MSEKSLALLIWTVVKQEGSPVGSGVGRASTGPIGVVELAFKERRETGLGTLFKNGRFDQGRFSDEC